VTAPAPSVSLDRGQATELARVLGVITEFFATRPAARASLGRFAYSGCGDPHFWTTELLDYLGETATELHQLATTATTENEETP